MDNVRRILKDSIEYCENPYDAAIGADAIFIATEWPEFRTPDFDRISSFRCAPAPRLGTAIELVCRDTAHARHSSFDGEAGNRIELVQWVESLGSAAWHSQTQRATE